MMLDELQSLREEIQNKQAITSYNIQCYFHENRNFYENSGHLALKTDITKTVNEIFDKSLELIDKEINKLQGVFNG